jgi:exosortase C (VPDSG-CTERM-specific)
VRLRLIGLAVLTAVLVASFARPLFALAKFAAHSELYSHILLIPFISAYLIWLKRGSLPLAPQPRRLFALFPLIAGLATIAGYWWAVRSGLKLREADQLAITTLSFLLLLLSVCFLCLGPATLRAITFPVAFLFFMIPFPHVALVRIETFFQHGSAEAAYLLLKLSGMPVFRQGLEFQLPGFSMQVAPQCSGIHSSLVLFMTSLLAGHLLLRTLWSRTLLVLVVIPLALLRNGFRIFTLGQLCVQLDPSWIDSDLHRRGGPIFFALSLIPFFLLLFYLRKLENRRTRIPSAMPANRHDRSPL